MESIEQDETLRIFARTGRAVLRAIAAVVCLWGAAMVNPVSARTPHPPKSAEDWREEGYRAAIAHDRAHSDAYFQRALSVDPNQYGIGLSQGWALFYLGDYEKALRIWENAFVGIDREYTNTALCLAIGNFKLDRPDSAMEWYAVQQCRNRDFNSLALMRLIVRRWHECETAALEGVYRLWWKADDEWSEHRTQLRLPNPSVGEAAGFSATPTTSKAAAQRLANRLLILYIEELRKLSFSRANDVVIPLEIVVLSDGRLAGDTETLRQIGFSYPLTSRAILNSLLQVAEHPDSPEAASGRSADHGFKFVMKFAVSLASPDGK